ncbi:hypothetical protein IW261DRAFT_1496793 [Armillaria novae-zelandiae]|uniref:Uncharacterized protein n=1 Tax=Armillaria novae-zelandiae TaxID=153914 RepID=A0AA39P0H7_9AGAR|nr:hypothetical protein IW261DRAFT_1496793 [Armillaria novae-zelandiae]
MVRIPDASSASSNARPVHRTRQKKVQSYQSVQVVAVKTTVKKEEPSDNNSIPPLLRSLSPKIGDIHGWRHPAELVYLDAVDWSKTDVIKFLVTHSFSVPGRPPHRGRWTTITCGDGSTTVIPTSYRIPLLFAANFQWTSLRLVLSVDAKIRRKEWNEYKGGILHISRLCDTLLCEARRAMNVGMKRTWRCKTFDRALARYRMGWLLSDPGKVQEFWDMYGNEEYEKDPVKLNWKRWVLKGYKGFKLDEEQIEGGISLDDWLDGLKKDKDDWVWDAVNAFPSSLSALQSLTHWKKTGTWAPEFEAPAHAVSHEIPHSTEPASCDTRIISPDKKHNSTSTEFLEILHSRLKEQEQRLSLVEAEVMKLKHGKADSTFPPHHTPPPTAFMPAKNFPDIQDRGCTERFWNDPLERFLDLRCLENIEPVVLSRTGVEETKDEASSGGPIKSLRKQHFMPGK